MCLYVCVHHVLHLCIIYFCLAMAPNYFSVLLTPKRISYNLVLLLFFLLSFKICSTFDYVYVGINVAGW